MLHCGFYVANPETAHYYLDILGFREFWRSSADGKSVANVNLMVPEGADYIEFMLGPKPTTPERYGSVYHIALEVPDMDAAVATLQARAAACGYKREIAVHIGKIHKKLCNLFDPDGMRIELTEDHTVDGLPPPITHLPIFAK